MNQEMLNVTQWSNKKPIEPESNDEIKLEHNIEENI